MVDLSTAVVALLSRVGLLLPLGLVVLWVILPSTFDELCPRRGECERDETWRTSSLPFPRPDASLRTTALLLPLRLLPFFALLLRLWEPGLRKENANRPPPCWPRVWLEVGFLRFHWRIALAVRISRMPSLLVRSSPLKVPRHLVTQPWMVDAFVRRVPSLRKSFYERGVRLARAST